MFNTFRPFDIIAGKFAIIIVLNLYQKGKKSFYKNVFLARSR